MKRILSDISCSKFTEPLAESGLCVLDPSVATLMNASWSRGNVDTFVNSQGYVSSSRSTCTYTYKSERAANSSRGTSKELEY